MILLKFEAMPNTFGTGFQHISNNQEKGAKKIKLRKKRNMFTKGAKISTEK